MIGVEDCIAMSEDGDWYAFPKTLRRGQVVAALAAETDWWTVIHETTIRAGFVRSEPGTALVYGTSDWWAECDADAPGAMPVWIARR